MPFIYLYASPFIPVKARVKAVGILWMTVIREFGLPENFPYFLSNIK